MAGRYLIWMVEAIRLRELDEHAWYMGERLRRQPTYEEVREDWNRTQEVAFRKRVQKHVLNLSDYLLNHPIENITKQEVHRLLGDGR